MRIRHHVHATLRKWRPTLAALLVALLGLACKADQPTGPQFVDLPPSPGTGTGTLRVVAQVEGREAGDTGFETEFLATVSDEQGAPVSGSVVVRGRFGTVQLVEGSPGSYRALISGYETGSYTLNVTRGDDIVAGVTILAPDVHSIFAPRAQEVVRANTALNVRWARDARSQESRLTTRDYDSDWIYGDPGTLFTPTIGNPPRTDQRVELTRRNSQSPEGALAGSLFSVGIRRAVEPVVSM